MTSEHIAMANNSLPGWINRTSKLCRIAAARAANLPY
jgi:hypothetical protein